VRTVDVKKTVPVMDLPSDESFDDDLPSPPMPSIPPPPPPTFEEEEESSYAIALFDFESDVAEDLNLRVSFRRISIQFWCLFRCSVAGKRKSLSHQTNERRVDVRTQQTRL
jgi:hypothetical protein